MQNRIPNCTIVGAWEMSYDAIVASGMSDDEPTNHKDKMICR